MLHKAPMMGMLGHEQPIEQFSNAWPITAWMYSRFLSSLDVIVRLTRAAIGRGSIASFPPEKDHKVPSILEAVHQDALLLKMIVRQLHGYQNT